MSNDAGFRPASKIQIIKDHPNMTPHKTSPKQKFHTIKNFLKNKSSFTDLRMFQEKKEDKNTRSTNVSNNSFKEDPNYKPVDIKWKIPKKKRSLGSLLPSHESKELFLNNYADEVKDFVPPAYTKNLPSTPNSTQAGVYRNPSISTKGSSKASSSPKKTSFSLEYDHTLSTPTFSTAETFVSDDWVPPGTIRGTYVHDWSNDSSPRSFIESRKVERFDKPMLVSTPSTPCKSRTFDKLSLSVNGSTLKPPNNPFPSPCTLSTENDLAIDNGNLTVIDEGISSTTLASQSNSHAGSSESCSVHSKDSFKSQFSFLRNRTSSVKFYKSKEQMQKENAKNAEKIERLRIKEFLGTDENSELLNEDYNYIDFDEDDETDELFNRDLFGLEQTGSPPGLELNDEDNEVAPNGLEITGISYSHDEVDNENLCDPGNRSIYGNNIEGEAFEEYEYKEPSRLELTDSEEDPKENTETIKSEGGYRYEPPSRLELTDSEEEGNDINKNIEYDSSADISIEEVKENEFEISHSNLSKELLSMLNRNDSNLTFKSTTSDISIKHVPSQKFQRHKSVKYHQLSADIESSCYSDGHIWENSSALEEVNQIPEDYDFEAANTFQPNPRKQRFSTMLSLHSNDSNLSAISDVDSNCDPTRQHLWKKLVIKNAVGNQRIERIQLDDRTITLYNRKPGVEPENDQSSISSYDTNDRGELSTIAE